MLWNVKICKICEKIEHGRIFFFLRWILLHNKYQKLRAKDICKQYVVQKDD